MNQFKQELLLLGLYLFLLFGVLWHVTGLFSSLVAFTTVPVMFFLSIIPVLTFLRRMPSSSYRWWISWMIVVISSTFFIEWIGVETGLIFGDYYYNSSLKPLWSDVPLVIGFAWLGAMLGSFAVLDRHLTSFRNLPVGIQAVLIGLLMMIFDLFLEPVAISLGYWTWESESVPIQNYLSWWGIGACLSLGFLIPKRLFWGDLTWARHSFYAQIVYFFAVILFV